MTAPTRWEAAGEGNLEYGRRFGQLVATGADIEGEARLADAMAPRHARILDAGAGMGRVGAALAARGHRVTAIEPDAALVAQARETYPELDIVETDILGFDTDERFDVIVCVGNVLIFLAEHTERDVLARLRGLLAPGGRILAGFHPVGGPTTSRPYRPEEFVADAEAAGLRVDHRFGTYELRPPSDDYTVWVLSSAL